MAGGWLGAGDSGVNRQMKSQAQLEKPRERTVEES